MRLSASAGTEMMGGDRSERGQHAQALACYRKALAVNPGFVDALNNSAVAVRRTGQTGEAESVLRKTVTVAEKSLGLSCCYVSRQSFSVEPAALSSAPFNCMPL